MRCGNAQRHLTTAAGDESRARAAAERHVAGCVACREELRRTRALFAALDEGPAETPVPPRLEQAILRAVRIAAAEEAERPARSWQAWIPVPALALAAVAIVALTLVVERGGDTPAVRTAPPARLASRPARTAAESPAPNAPRAVEAPVGVARREPIAAPPAEPPPELASRPDLFIDLPILRHLEKLDHYEQIETTGNPDAPVHPADGEGQTNG